MNKIENISIVVMEECAEVQQAISKALRFGYDCYDPSNPDTNNAIDILTEYYQLEAMMDLLISESSLDKYLSVEEIIQIKNNKTKKFLKYQEISEELGNVEDGGIVGVYDVNFEDLVKKFRKLGYTDEEANEEAKKAIEAVEYAANIDEELLDRFNNLVGLLRTSEVIEV